MVYSCKGQVDMCHKCDIKCAINVTLKQSLSNLKYKRLYGQSEMFRHVTEVIWSQVSTKSRGICSGQIMSVLPAVSSLYDANPRYHYRTNSDIMCHFIPLVQKV